MNVENLSIDVIGLSVRSTNALHRKGIHYVEDLLNYDRDMLSTIRNLGEKSINDIVEKIEYYKNLSSIDNAIDIVDNIDNNIILEYLYSKDATINDLELLPTKAYNLLLINGYEKLDKIIFLSKEELLHIHNMDSDSARSIVKSCKRYIRKISNEISQYFLEKSATQKQKFLFNLDVDDNEENREAILSYVRLNDVSVKNLQLSNRTLNPLLRKDLNYMSDIVLMSKDDFMKIPKLGSCAVNEIINVISRYILQHKDRLENYVSDDANIAINDDKVKRVIINSFDTTKFEGLSFTDIVSRIKFPVKIPLDKIKKMIGQLISERKLEYVDYRCYRVYDRFIDYVSKCYLINHREKSMIIKKLNGKTLEEIGNEYGVTRERIRQIVNKNIKKVRSCYISETGLSLFDEEYYTYLYKTYNLDFKDCSEWLGIPPYVWNFLDLLGVKKGNKDLEDAIKDVQNLDAGMRLRIKNYINRDKMFIDGKWVKINRYDLERAIIKKCCKKEVTAKEFSDIFNNYLRNADIPFDENVYYTDKVLRSRKNRLAEADFVLWKFGERFRYYDINSLDYSELLETLDLGSYLDVEISTAKFFETYPELMEKYDIHDPYELHNLLKKVLSKIKTEEYSKVHFSKMPTIRFGYPNREKTLYTLMVENSPISMNDLCELIHSEYGYDLRLIPSYLSHLMDYNSNGIFRVDQKKISEENKSILLSNLTDDFYFFDEIKDIYRNVIPNADVDEINTYNLKKMGFLVFSKYAIKNFNSAEEYFRDMFTKEDTFDISPFRIKYSNIVIYYQVFMELKRELEIIEFEPDKFINFRKLKCAGITKDMIKEFCDDAYEFAEDQTFFSIQLLKINGFDSELFELGFDYYFYSSLIISDERFSWQKMFGTIFFYKGKYDVSLRNIIVDIVKQYQKIDIYEIDTILREQYGCIKFDRYDIMPKIHDTDIFYDSELQKFYADQEYYYREIDETGGE